MAKLGQEKWRQHESWNEFYERLIRTEKKREKRFPPRLCQRLGNPQGEFTTEWARVQLGDISLSATWRKLQVLSEAGLIHKRKVFERFNKCYWSFDYSKMV